MEHKNTDVSEELALKRPDQHNQDFEWRGSFRVLAVLWGLGALGESSRECTAFLIMPKRPYQWRVDTQGCCKYDNAALGFGPRDQTAHLPVFPHLRTTNLPGPDSILRSE